jgi:hypothetical protein
MDLSVKCIFTVTTGPNKQVVELTEAQNVLSLPLKGLRENDFDMKSDSPESFVSRAKRHWSIALQDSHTGF